MHTVKTSKPICRIFVRNKSDKVCWGVSMIPGTGPSLTMLKLHPAQLLKGTIYICVGQIFSIPLWDTLTSLLRTLGYQLVNQMSNSTSSIKVSTLRVQNQNYLPLISYTHSGESRDKKGELEPTSGSMTCAIPFV